MDYTSSLYLGFEHSASELRPWRRLTLGKPAAIGEWPDFREMKIALAKLCGGEKVLLGRSSLHLFWDLFAAFDPRKWEFIVDEFSYPIARWAVGQLCGKGGRVHLFRHMNSESAANYCEQAASSARYPAIITDSLCSVCGKIPDLGRYMDLLDNYGGCLITDDTQALGLFGANPSRNNPLGYGGGGSIKFHNLPGRNIIAVSSLAKAFGAPIGIALGSDEFLTKMQRHGQTIWHSSQPSIVDLEATRNALKLNATKGTQLRHHLISLIRYFQHRAAINSLEYLRSFHPAQAIIMPSKKAGVCCYQNLASKGINVLLGKGHRGEYRLIFMLTSNHTESAIESALEITSKTLSNFKPAIRAASNTNQSLIGTGGI